MDGCDLESGHRLLGALARLHPLLRDDARRHALRNHPSRKGLTKDTKAGPVWTGEVRFNEGWLTQPLSWKKPRMVFVCAHGDLFHEDVPDAWIDQGVRSHGAPHRSTRFRC
jgi:protein gp37